MKAVPESLKLEVTESLVEAVRSNEAFWDKLNQHVAFEFKQSKATIYYEGDGKWLLSIRAGSDNGDLYFDMPLALEDPETLIRDQFPGTPEGLDSCIEGLDQLIRQIRSVKVEMEAQRIMLQSSEEAAPS